MIIARKLSWSTSFTQIYFITRNILRTQFAYLHPIFQSMVKLVFYFDAWIWHSNETSCHFKLKHLMIDDWLHFIGKNRGQSSPPSIRWRSRRNHHKDVQWQSTGKYGSTGLEYDVQHVSICIWMDGCRSKVLGMV